MVLTIAPKKKPSCIIGIFGLSEADGEVRLADVMMFMSGSSKVPATGFPKTPTIRFTDVDCVSTSDVSITDVSITDASKEDGSSNNFR